MFSSRGFWSEGIVSADTRPRPGHRSRPSIILIYCVVTAAVVTAGVGIAGGGHLERGLFASTKRQAEN